MPLEMPLMGLKLANYNYSNKQGLLMHEINSIFASPESLKIQSKCNVFKVMSDNDTFDLFPFSTFILHKFDIQKALIFKRTAWTISTPLFFYYYKTLKKDGDFVGEVQIRENLQKSTTGALFGCLV